MSLPQQIQEIYQQPAIQSYVMPQTIVQEPLKVSTVQVQPVQYVQQVKQVPVQLQQVAIQQVPVKQIIYQPPHKHCLWSLLVCLIPILIAIFAIVMCSIIIYRYRTNHHDVVQDVQFLKLMKDHLKIKHEVTSRSHKAIPYSDSKIHLTAKCEKLDPEDADDILQNSTIIRKWLFILSICVIVFSAISVLCGLACCLAAKSVKNTPVKVIYVCMLINLILIGVGALIWCVYYHGDDELKDDTEDFQEYLKNDCPKDEKIKKSVQNLLALATDTIHLFGHFWCYLWWFTLGFTLIALLLPFLKWKECKEHPSLENPCYACEECKCF